MEQPHTAIFKVMAGVVGVFGQRETYQSESMLLMGHCLAAGTHSGVDGAGGKVPMPVQTNMVCLDLEALSTVEEYWVHGDAERGLMLRECEIVTHCHECCHYMLLQPWLRT